MEDIIPIRVPIQLNLLFICLCHRVHCSQRTDNQPPTLIQVLRAMGCVRILNRTKNTETTTELDENSTSTYTESAREYQISPSQTLLEKLATSLHIKLFESNCLTQTSNVLLHWSNISIKISPSLVYVGDGGSVVLLTDSSQSHKNYDSVVLLYSDAFEERLSCSQLLTVSFCEK